MEFFDCTDEGWIQSQEVEKRLIKQFYQNDKWCLNENCGGIISINICKEAGNIGGKLGGMIMGKKLVELKQGIHGRTKEQRKDDCKKGGRKTSELRTGIHSRSEKQRKVDSKKGGQKSFELQLGIHGRSKEQMSEDGRKGGKIAGRISTSQVWECTITGHRSNAAALSRYQKKRNIDVSNRIRIL